jgi:hypothetical protein
MITVFGISVLIVNVVNVVAIFCLPFVLRAQASEELGALGLGNAVDGFLQAELALVAPFLVASFLMSVQGTVSAIGILGRRNWARWSWLIHCMLWPVLQLAFAIWMPPWDFEDTTILAFRLAAIYISACFLFSTEGRREFVSQ